MIGSWWSQIDRRNMFGRNSVNWKIFNAMLTVGGFGLIVSLTTAGKELVLAYQYGISDVMDAFLIAYILPSLLVNVLTGSFEVAFIPEYIKVREIEGEDAAGRLFSYILSWYLVFILILSLILYFISSLIIPMLGSNLSADTIALSESLFLMLIPLLLLTGLVRAWGSVLNAGERFALAAITPLIVPILTIIVLVGLGEIWGIYALTVGMIVGFIFQAGFLMWGLKSKGYHYLPSLNRFNVSIRNILVQYFPMIVGLLLMGSTLFVDQTMAATIGPGSVSALNYGNRIVVFIVGICSMALSTAIFPYFSRMVAQKDWKSIRHTLRTYSRVIFLTSVPLTLVFVYFSEPIVRLVFERGAFTKTDTELVGRVQAFYFLQVPFYLLGILGVRLLSALSKNYILMLIGGFNLIVNIIGNYIFMKYWDIAGIGLSTSMVYVVSTFLIFKSLNKELCKKEVSIKIM